MKRTVILGLVVILCSTPAFARIKINEDGISEGNKKKHKRWFFTQTLDDLAVEGKIKHIPQNNKVIVPYFRVTFATGGNFLNKEGGVTTSKTRVYSKLNGVSEDAMQEITNQMYADLLAQLKEAGYEVMDLSELEGNANYQKLQESSKFPIIKKTHAQFTPDKRYFPGTIPVKAYMLAREVDALMLQADYTVNFVVLKANEKKFNILNDKSDVEVSQGINVFGHLAVITESGPVTFRIQQPINSNIVFGQIEDATTAMNKVSDGVALASSLLSGKFGDRQSTNTVEVTSTNEEYKSAATDALSKSNATLASFMAASINGEELIEVEE